MMDELFYGETANHPKGLFRVLFPVHFNLKGLYRFVAQLLRLQYDYPSFEFEVVVVVTDIVYVDTIKKTINFCGGSHADIRFVTDTFDNFVQRTEATNVGLFDYIEFNGGLNIRSTYRSVLSSLRSLLSSNGIIGLTAFTSNKMVEEIR